jgi:hypothetical protein
MRESRGRTRHTLGREHETPRIIQRREEYEGERERGQSLKVQEEETHILSGYIVGTDLGAPQKRTRKS